ncbi:hypothetical protein LAZ67_16001449 [Cordylochernes scorpioides]|uniref:Tc1-like transposase DDE domain-containing protein n=1 Tax=Cordylochernes scorpioides TaxID=51811 RepID=A0ABY6LE13_9ARAC|nr:hypothetical protein LAZ67_16001449 [Cordylochernes scorpioides]
MAIFGKTWFSGVLGKTHLNHIVWRNNRLWTTFYSDALLSSDTECRQPCCLGRPPSTQSRWLDSRRTSSDFIEAQRPEMHFLWIRNKNHYLWTIRMHYLWTIRMHYLFDCAALSEEKRKLNDKTGQLCPSFPALINEISKKRFHELKVGDFEKRQEFAAWDDAYFYLNGEFNTQNSRIWATENPRVFTEMPLHQPRVTVLCGLTSSSSFIIGPFFFEKINGKPLKPFLQVLSEITFMQDGGPPHISRCAKQLLKDTFGENRVISRHFIHQWPPRSPDLTPCDFWLWGYIKSCVYRCRPTKLAMLKYFIRWHVLSISTEIFFNAVHYVIYRL